MLCVIAGGVMWYSHRPRREKPWNQSAIKATPSGIDFSVQADRAVAIFKYSFQNTTQRDYTPASDARLMVRLPEGMGYRDAPGITLQQNLYVPSGQKVNVSLTLPILYSDYNFSEQKSKNEKQIEAFIERRLAEIDGFALFDPANRYKVDFPNGWPEAVKRVKEREASKTPKSDAK
jgi:hypothetical protein